MYRAGVQKVYSKCGRDAILKINAQTKWSFPGKRGKIFGQRFEHVILLAFFNDIPLFKGYQMILKRRLPDGSFRLWSEGKDASVWLTAYVAKILAHTKKFVEVEDKMIYSALNFIKSLQSPEGRWSDANIGTYYYISQTGSQKSYALNAFIVISFLENEAHKKEFKTTIEDAMTYLSSHITEVRDNHAIAMIAYAAALNNQNVFADQLLTKLNETANIANDKMWWFREDPGNPTESVPVQVEIAAYTVMALVKSNRAVAAMKIVNWLLTKRNQNGGFISTTDTVIGIQALAMFATAVNSAEMKMDIEINNQVKYHINETNALQLQHKELLPTTKRISIEAKGVGFAYLQITTSYDVIATAPTQQFRVSVQAVPNKLKLQLNICASFIAKGEQKMSRMSLMEIFLPSGYEFDSEASKPSISSAGVKVSFASIITFLMHSLFFQPTANGNPSAKQLHSPLLQRFHHSRKMSQHSC